MNIPVRWMRNEDGTWTMFTKLDGVVRGAIFDPAFGCRVCGQTAKAGDFTIFHPTTGLSTEWEHKHCSTSL